MNQFVISLLAFRFLNFDPVHALEADREVETQIRWVNDRGTVVSLPFQKSTQWVWSEFSADRPPELRLRTWVEVPDGVKLVVPTTLASAKAADPFKPQPKHYLVPIDTRDVFEAVPVTLIKGKEQQKLKFIINVTSKSRLVFVHKDCTRQGIQLDQQGDPPPYFVGLFCTARSLFFLHDSRVKAQQRSSGLAKIRALKDSFSIELDADLSDSGLAQIETLADNKRTLYTISRSVPKFLIHRVQLAAELGSGYSRYTETVINRISAGIVPVDVGVGGRFLHYRPWWESSARFQFSLYGAPLTSDAGDAAVRFYRLDLGSRVHLPQSLYAWRLSFELGAYFWGMWVPNALYGVKFSSGLKIGPHIEKQWAATPYRLHLNPWFGLPLKEVDFVFRGYEVGCRAEFNFYDLKGKFPLGVYLGATYTKGETPLLAFERQYSSLRIQAGLTSHFLWLK